jgi:hypothetical protein
MDTYAECWGHLPLIRALWSRLNAFFFFKRVTTPLSTLDCLVTQTLIIRNKQWLKNKNLKTRSNKSFMWTYDEIQSYTKFQFSESVRSIDHELIPARNLSLVAIQCSASGSNIRYYPSWKHLPLKERNEQGYTMLPNCPMFAVRLWSTTSTYRRPVRSLPSTCMICTPPRTALRTFTRRRDQRDLWTVPFSRYIFTFIGSSFKC